MIPLLRKCFHMLPEPLGRKLIDRLMPPIVRFASRYGRPEHDDAPGPELVERALAAVGRAVPKSMAEAEALFRRFTGADGFCSHPFVLPMIFEFYYAQSREERSRHEAAFLNMLRRVNLTDFLKFLCQPGISGDGLSFKRMFLELARDGIEDLKKGLDAESRRVVDTCVFRMLYLPHNENSVTRSIYFARKDVFDERFQTEQERADERRFYSELGTYAGQYAYDEYIEPCVFMFHHGLRFAGEKTVHYVKNKVFIDGGAWKGDSALVFHKHYAPSKVHSFEISRRTCEEYRRTMARNGIEASRYVLTQAGLGESGGQTSFCDNELASASLLVQGETQTAVLSLDDYIFTPPPPPLKISAPIARPIENIGFIKMDVEGAGLQALKGSVKTITTYWPVLSLSIYHNPEEFFEIKPFLEAVTEGAYDISVRRFQIEGDNIFDTCLFAVPKTLL